jgi:anti-anti-sigma factor
MATKSSLTYPLPADPSLTNIRNLIEAGEKHLAEGSTPLLLNLEKLSYANSLLIGAFLKLHNLYHRKERALTLINVKPDVYELLSSSGLIHILNVTKPEEVRIDTTGAAVNLGIELDFEIYKDVGIFKFSGSMLTPHDSELFYNMALRILKDGHKMLIDMSDLVYIDSMGIGSIIKIYKIMREHKGEIRICSAGDILKGVLESQNLTFLIPLYDTRDQALRDWQ